MRATLASAVVVFSLTISPFVLAQKQSATTPRGTLGPLDVRVLLHPQARPSGAALAASANAVAQGLASPGGYRFASVDFPGAASSDCFDMNASVTVGALTYNPSSPTAVNQAFTLQNGFYRTLNIPGAAKGSVATGINSIGEIVGVFFDSSNAGHGFIRIGTTYATVDVPAATATEILDVNDSGEVVGGFVDATGTHGFTFLGGVFHTVDYPGALSTLVGGVNSAGDLVGVWTDGMNVQHGFELSGGVFTSYDFPLSVDTLALGINDSGDISGYFFDASFTQHGFIYSDGAFSQVDVAGAAQVNLVRVKNNGRITGIYVDSLKEVHGLTGR